jgi:hypothetical protein
LSIHPTRDTHIKSTNPPININIDYDNLLSDILKIRRSLSASKEFAIKDKPGTISILPVSDFIRDPNYYTRNRTKKRFC